MLANRLMANPGPKPRPLAVRAWRKHRPTALKALAEYLGISVPAVSKWPYVPESRLAAVADFMGLSLRDLRPDLYPPDPWSAL